MIDWLNIGKLFGKNEMAAKFEKLAFSYVQDVYSEYDWKTTPASGDGNKDAHLGQGVEFDIWEEAKYKGFSAKSGRQYTVRRQDLDTTILSGLQQGNVRLIVFVSNSVIPPELYERAAFSSKLKGIELTYILRAQLEGWIYHNKNVFREIFGIEPKLDLEDAELFNVDSVSIFDMHRDNFSEITRIKELIVRERYVMHVTISSSSYAKATIQNSVFDILDHPDFTQSTFDIAPGVNSLRFLISPITQHCNRVNLRFHINDKEFNTCTPEVIIEENKYPSLTYSRQLEIISAIKTLINCRAQTSDGVIANVYGRSSMGKSYILKSLYAEYLFRHESLYVDFDINEIGGINERYLCRLLIFLNYGNVFLYNPLKTKADTTRLKKYLEHLTTSSDIDKNLRNRLVDGCLDYTAAVSVIRELSLQFDGFVIPTTKFNLCRLLFVDDVQNLNEIQFGIITKIVNQINRCKTNILFVLSATQDAFKSTDTQNKYETLTQNKFELCGLSQRDKSQTLRNHFNVFSRLENSLSNIILPSSPLLASEILLLIMRESRSASLYDIIAAYNKINQNSILTNKFSQHEHLYYLLDIICLFKLGISKEYLFAYPAFLKKKLRNDIDILTRAGILVNNGSDRISFSHDLYNLSYQRLRNGKQYNSDVGLFLKYWYEKTRETDLDKNILLSSLIRCDEKYLEEYKERVFEIIVLNAQCTNFNVSLYYCEYYFKMLLGRLNRSLSERERYILYLYSDCLVHCGLSGEAERVFEEILDSTEVDSLQYLEIRISLLNQWFWSLKKLNRLIGDSLLLQHQTELLINNLPYSEVPYRLKKCESTCHNRRMVTQLLLDDYDAARKTYANWLRKTAQRVTGSEFKNETAVLIMDYARGISYLNPVLAEKLMSIAYSYMYVECEKNFRRFLLCKIDLLMLQSINGKEINKKEFENIVKTLGQNNFRSECFKAVLKYFAVKLVDECKWLVSQNMDDPYASTLQVAFDRVHQCLLQLKFVPKEREEYLYNILFAFIDIKEKNYSAARQKLEKALKFVEPAGKSYSEALLHNLNQIESIKKIAWYWEGVEVQADTYYLDCRFW